MFNAMWFIGVLIYIHSNDGITFVYSHQNYTQITKYDWKKFYNYLWRHIWPVYPISVAARVWTLTDRLCTRTFRVCTPTLLKSVPFAAQRGSDPLSMLWEKPTMSVIYADNVWHHSQSFRIMVKGWKWDPHIWYDVLYNLPSTHKIMQIFKCKPKLRWYAPVSSLDNTICDAWKTCKDFEFSLVAILKILNGGYHKNQVMYPHIVKICYTAGHQ